MLFTWGWMTISTPQGTGTVTKMEMVAASQMGRLAKINK